MKPLGDALVDDFWPPLPDDRAETMSKQWDSVWLKVVRREVWAPLEEFSALDLIVFDHFAEHSK